jgi:hypothetical protein
MNFFQFYIFVFENKLLEIIFLLDALALDDAPSLGIAI